MNIPALRNLVFIVIGSSLIVYGLFTHPERLLPQPVLTPPAAPVVAPSSTLAIDSQIKVAGGLALTADTSGHFRGTALINGVSMPFLIDTGATRTTIPYELAKMADLPIGEVERVMTANGEVAAITTTLARLQLGNAVLTNVDANVADSINEVLIGMSTLKHFQLHIDNNTLKLMAYHNQNATTLSNDTEQGHDEAAQQDNAQPPKTWKKSVVCNANGSHCITSYSE